MRKSKQSLFLLIVWVLYAGCAGKPKQDELFLSYELDAKQGNLAFYYRDDRMQRFGSLDKLEDWLSDQGEMLEFAVNGGMYDTSHQPKGLYIESHKLVHPLDTGLGAGNFYLKPNGVFYITDDHLPVVCKTEDFAANAKIEYATQSGPMLVMDGQINPLFTKGSSNLNIRNGVGILPDHRVLFVQSRKKVSFYELAEFFKSRGCRNALFLDGFVSRTYLPEQNWVQRDGDFGVIIGVSRPK